MNYHNYSIFINRNNFIINLKGSLSRGSLDDGALSRDFYFDFLFYDDVEGDHAVISMSLSFQGLWTFTLSALLTLEMQVTIMNKEDDKEYVNNYGKSFHRDPGDADIKDHL